MCAGVACVCCWALLLTGCCTDMMQASVTHSRQEAVVQQQVGAGFVQQCIMLTDMALMGSDVSH